MIRLIAPQFFSPDLRRTLAYFTTQLGFTPTGTFGDPPFYAILQRDGHTIHLRLCEDPPRHPDKYTDDFLDAYIWTDSIDALYAEYQSRNVEFHQELKAMPWNTREFVVKDCDGRLLCFGQDS
jgi:hypothetical protein